MEVVFALPLLFIPFFMPFIAGQMAKSFGRKFWPWFMIGIPLPFVANIILLCLPDKSKQEPTVLKAVDKETNIRTSFYKQRFTTRNIDSGNHFAA